MLMSRIDPDAEKEELVWDEAGRWWVGRVNRFAAVTADHRLPERVTIMDSTLREGEEFPGSVLTLKAKVRLAHEIVAAGFRELEVGYAGVILEHQELLDALKREKLPVKLASHTRVYGREHEWKEEIDRNLECGADILTMVGFASEVGTATTPWLPKQQVPDRIARCVQHAKQQGAIVAFGLADLVRTRMDYIVACYRAAARAGADRLYVYDGLGAATPEAIAYLTRLLQDIAGPGPAIGVHVHDTFGMATAAAVRAVTAGASVVDAVPLGVGDGAGIAATEEVVAALEVLYGVRTGIDLSRLKQLAEAVAASLGISVPPNKALVGTNQYRHSIDSHVASILRGAWHSWEVIRPEVVGHKRELQFGHARLRRGQSGALYAKAEQLGYQPTPAQLDEILSRVRALTLTKPYATEAEVEQIIREVVAS